MQMGVVMSHLHLALANSIFIFMLANKLVTSIVALYFFMSGYGLLYGYKRATLGTKNPFEGFWIKRIWGLAKPFFAALIIYLLLVFLDKGTIPSNIIYNLIRYGIPPLPNSWFVFILLALYVSFYLVFDKFRGNTRFKLAILFIAGIILTIIPILLDYGRAWWATTLAFATGALYAEYEQEIFSLMNKWWVVLISLCLILLTLLLPWDVFIPLAFIPIPLLIVKLLNVCGYCKAIDKLYSNTDSSASSAEDNKMHPSTKMQTVIISRCKSILSFLSKISFELYLIHGVWIALLRGAHIFIQNDMLYSGVVILLSILSAWLIHLALNWASHKK